MILLKTGQQLNFQILLIAQFRSVLQFLVYLACYFQPLKVQHFLLTSKFHRFIVRFSQQGLFILARFFFSLEKPLNLNAVKLLNLIISRALLHSQPLFRVLILYAQLRFFIFPIVEQQVVTLLFTLVRVFIQLFFLILTVQLQHALLHGVRLFP